MTIMVFISITGHMVIAGIFTSSITHSVFPLPLASTLTGHGSLPGGMAQTFLLGYQ